MKIKESGMPDKKTWEGFFSPASILKTLQVNKKIKDVVEFGCGYGTFTIPVAQIIRGNLFAYDIEPEMVEITKEEALIKGVKNVRVIVRDIMADGTGLKTESVDYVMLFNILTSTSLLFGTEPAHGIHSRVLNLQIPGQE